MRGRFFFVLVLACLCGFRCSLPWDKGGNESLVIASYNVHNLFDAQDDGKEYPEFSVASGKWNAELYRRRLENVAQALCFLDGDGKRWPDVLCLEEIEGKKVLVDLAVGSLAKAEYGWMACAGPEASPVCCGILSRFPILSVKSHALADAWGYGSGRDILEAELDLGSEWAQARMTLFVCHWKSRREGEGATEIARKGASALLASRMARLAEESSERPMIVCGDFNESPDEFERSGRRYPTALMPDPAESIGGRYSNLPAEWFKGAILVSGRPEAARAGSSGVVLYSPWAGREGYSYMYKGKGERLDGFLLGPGFSDSKGLEFSGFSLGEDPSLMDDSGAPLAWTGTSGYSDHLPIACTLRLADIK